MKVLHCFHDYLKPTESWAYRLIVNVPDVEQFIVAKTYRKTNFYHPALQFIEYPLSPFKRTVKSFWLHVAHTINHQLRKRITFDQYVQKMCSFHKIDVMHFHFANIGWEYHQLANKTAIPYVISFYGIDYECLPYREPVWMERYKILFKEAAAFVCEGANGVKILEKMGCPAEKIHVIRLGIDVDKVPYVQREKKEGSLNLLQIATYTEKKGHIYSLKAFEKALKTCPNMKLSFLGGAQKGTIRKELERFAVEKGIRNKVTFLDFIDYDKLHEFMGAFDVFIHPSVYAADMNCEGGAPVVLMDAQATGMPVVSTTHCDIPEVVIHSETGLLAKEKDVDQIATCIENFYKMDQAEFEVYSKTARKHIETNYNSALNSIPLAGLYKKLKEEKAC